MKNSKYKTHHTEMNTTFINYKLNRERDGRVEGKQLKLKSVEFL